MTTTPPTDAQRVLGVHQEAYRSLLATTKAHLRVERATRGHLDRLVALVARNQDAFAADPQLGATWQAAVDFLAQPRHDDDLEDQL